MIGDTKKETELVTKQEANSRSVTLIEYQDGALGFSTDFAETFIYLYKDQVDQLKKILANERMKKDVKVH